MVTVQQKKLVQGVVEGKSIAQAGADAGYANRQNAHRALTTNDDVRTTLELALVKAGIDDAALTAAIARLLNSENEASVNNAIKHLITLQGLAAPSKSVSVKLSYAEQAKAAQNGDNTQSITPQHSDTTHHEGGRGSALRPTVSVLVA